jgi:hypothetical protein
LCGITPQKGAIWIYGEFHHQITPWKSVILKIKGYFEYPRGELLAAAALQ